MAEQRQATGGSRGARAEERFLLPRNGLTPRRVPASARLLPRASTPQTASPHNPAPKCSFVRSVPPERFDPFDKALRRARLAEEWIRRCRCGSRPASAHERMPCAHWRAHDASPYLRAGGAAVLGHLEGLPHLGTKAPCRQSCCNTCAAQNMISDAFIPWYEFCDGYASTRDEKTRAQNTVGKAKKSGTCT